MGVLLLCVSGRVACCVARGSIGPAAYPIAPPALSSQEMDEASVELSLDDVYAVIEACGLEIVQRQEDVTCAYTSNGRSMMRTSYQCAFFTAVKRARTRAQ